MKVAIISSREFSGGAAMAAHRLWLGLRECSELVVRRYLEHREDPRSDAIEFSGMGRVDQAAHALISSIGFGGFEGWRRVRQRQQLKALVKLLRREPPDIINIHSFNEWTRPGLARGTAASELAEIAPIVWTLHDLWPLTGVRGFTGAQELSKRAVGCGAKTKEGKKLLALGDRLTWVGPSQWMAEMARHGYGKSNRVAHIPYGIDTDELKPTDKRAARRECNLPENAVIITLVAHFLHSTLKGAEILVGAAARLPPDVLVLLVGDPGPDRTRYQRENVRLLGSISDSRLLRAVYAASDMIAVPSHEDNLPNVLLEAMAIGVPVIGANVGGIPDVIQHGSNGWIVPTNDQEQWVVALRGAISGVKLDSERWRARARELAVKSYALSIQANRYREMFKQVRSGGTLRPRV